MLINNSVFDMKLNRSTWSFVVIVFTLFISPLMHAQQTSETVYKSSADQLVTVEKVAVLPFADNVGGIYSRPLENHLLKVLEKNHHWDLVETSTVGPILTPVEISQDINQAKQISRSLGEADAFFACRISKGPNGLNIHLSLFLTKDSLLFAQAELKNYARFDIEDAKAKLEELFQKIKNDIPYSARVLSRQGNRVTVNLGINDGIQANQIVPVIQIIKLNRHPKFNFLISTEKEILGRVKLLKVENTLSFGMILSERENGAIQVNSKIAGIDFVKYPDTDSLTSGSTAEDQLSNREDKDISFGKNPQEWVPAKPPSFGRVGANFGLGLFTGKTSLRDGDNLSESATAYPGVYFDGELWLTSKWAMHFALAQAIITVDNPRSGSTPAELSQSLSKYEFLFGYYMRFGGSIWQPWVELLAGYSSYELKVDNSNPTAFTTQEYTGFKLGVRGQVPVTRDQRWFAGARAHYTLFPSLNESPVTSGSSSESTIIEFGAFVGYKWSPNIQFTGALDLSQYQSTFSGDGSHSTDANSASHRHVVFSGGINYFF